jgi:membrane protein implicated in regulation of membrane protease activity
MSDEVRIKRERILLSKIAERYTKDQITLWGQLNMVIGAIAITAVHFGARLFGVPPLDWIWQGILLVVLVPVGYLYYRQYKQTKEKDE